MSNKRKQFDGVGIGANPDPTISEGAQKIFGLRADEDYAATIRAEPTPIEGIWADVKQPRRAIPASIRMHWNGDPAEVPALLETWHGVAQEAVGEEIRVLDVLMGRTSPPGPHTTEGEKETPFPAIAGAYVDLLALAADIRQIGLTNPITVLEQRGRSLIETGERRWLAYWLLHLNLGEMTWGKIPARRSDGRDYVWRQASENTARRQLNAIGMARQLALLIMAAREGLDGVQYDEFEDVVLPGGCDRRFYAQVANGNLHRIPKGMGERIQTTMGLSESQLAHYRRLLRLFDDDQANDVNDALWVKADVEDWPEGTLREISTFTPVKVREVIQGDSWELKDLRGLALTPRPPLPHGEGESTLPHGKVPQEPGVVQFEPGERVMTRGNHLGTVIAQMGRLVTVKTDNDRVSRTHHAVDLQRVDLPLQHAEGEKEAEIVFTRGEAVMVKHTEQIGKLVSSYKARDGRFVVVDINGVVDNFRASEVMQLGMDYDEYTEAELAHDRGVTFEQAPESEADTEAERESGDLNGLLYSEAPSTNPEIEQARQIALRAMGEDHRYLQSQIKGHTGMSGAENEVRFGGGKVWANYGYPHQKAYPFARNQVAVVLKKPGRDQVFRFNAERLMDWKLSNMPRETPPPDAESLSHYYDRPHTPAPALETEAEEMRRLWKANPAAPVVSGTDKGPSASSREGRVLVEHGSAGYVILTNLLQISVALQDRDTSKVLNEVLDLTLSEAQYLAQGDLLDGLLNGHYAHLMQKMSEWAAVLQEVFNTMSETGYE